MTPRHPLHLFHALPFGAELVAPGRTRFRLWAPSCTSVALAVEGRPDLAMRETGDGWFEVESDDGPGASYRYRVTPKDGDRLLVPDPASRAQAGDVDDPSLVVDPNAYRWRHDDWHGRPWIETVVYELHPGLAGGFDGIRRLLPGLAALGITAIELMPVADFAGPRNWGYDGVLPFAPDASYGTPDQMKAMIDAAHGLGLMVFLDVVYNHFGPEGNHLGTYAAAFFRDDVKTPWGRAIDFRRPEVRSFFNHNALYWLTEYRLDGLRLDATHSIVPQDWLFELSGFLEDRIEPGRHMHLVVEHEGNAARLLRVDEAGPGFDAQWNDDGHHVLHALLTGENDGYYVDFATDSATKLARCLSEGFIYQGQLSVFKNCEPRGEPSADLSPTSFVTFLQNHDQIGNRAFGERLTTLADPDALMAASAMLLLLPHIPLLFMGEEWGATEPFLFFTSFPDEALATAVREGRRGEFAKARGFADEAVRDTIPDPNAVETFEKSRLTFDDLASVEQSSRWLAHTKSLLIKRCEHIVPRLAGSHSLGADPIGSGAVVARWKMGDGAMLTVAVNLHAEAVAVPNPIEGELIHATPAASAEGPATRLPGRTTRVYLEAVAST